MIVRLTREAVRDLEAIGDYIAGENLSRAVSFIRDLRQACLGLADMPLRFPLLTGYEARDVRRRLHGNYLIFFLVQDEEAIVLHILHGASDYRSVMGSA